MFATRPGDHLPAGARPREQGINFSVFSRNATRMWLHLYDSATALEPLQVIELDPATQRTFFFWHVFVEGAGPGLYYTWRADGPSDTAVSGCCFDKRRDLLDPWARAVDASLWDRDVAVLDPDAPGIRARVLPQDGYDWEGDRPVGHGLADSIIYELHVGGFTRDPDSGVTTPGTFSGLIEKIPYLTELGITHVELLPIMAFDEQDVPDGVAKLGLSNFWGYSTYGFFAPHPAYTAGGDPRIEFRDMVKALHRAGIGVILDVVFNHTAEGGAGGPIINFKGFGNEFFYHLDPADRSHYRDFTGTGNTVNCNHPLVGRFIIDCLEYWARDMHVDGFRLDLASVLARGEDGEPMQHAPVLWAAEFSTALHDRHLIAEAWDAGGLYQVGDFPGYRWCEWNGDYRDVIRQCVRGDGGRLGRLASRVAGSSDLYAAAGRLPTNSINFVTCHDGFTLQDLVSYDHKHNEANGEDNRDGSSHNYSWNCGQEGPSTEAAINRLRSQQARNFLTLLLVSQGVPMLLAGDEVLRSQKGNNNTYCQDNRMGWFDWSLVQKNWDMLRFTRELIAFRHRHATLRRERFLTGERRGGQPPDVAWHGARLAEPDWHDEAASLIAFTLTAIDPDESDVHVAINLRAESHGMRLPAGQWRAVIETARPAPHDIRPAGEGRLLRSNRVVVPARSCVVLEREVGKA
ncbi:MAG: glycogen debranching protein GlgX [Gammaproteobacteria bacterium]|nr:glycogen debranching protein GlgX [Gammaproteobacteria bacterium]